MMPFLMGFAGTVPAPIEIQAGSILDVANIASLRAIDVSGVPDKTQASVGGYAAWGDGGGGMFVYDAGSSATADNGTIFAPIAGSGRWKRIYSGSVNVRWFGAKGDDDADDTAAIQSAIDSRAGAVVYVPAGTYKTTAPLRLPNAACLIGESPTTTTIKKTTTTADTLGSVSSPVGGTTDDYNVDSVISIVHGAADFARLNRIEKLRLDRTTLGSSSYGIFAPRISYARIADVYINRATYGIRAFTLFLTDIDDCVMTACAYGFALDNDGSGTGGSTSLRLQRFYCNFDNSIVEPVSGIRLYGLNYSNLVSCAVDKAIRTDDTAPMAYFLNLCQGVHLSGCGTEQTKGHVIWLQSCKALTVTGMNAAPITGNTFSGTIAVRQFSNSTATFMGCNWAAVSSPGNIYNNVITDGSNITDINEGTALSGGNTYVGYGGGSSWSKLVDGQWKTQTSSTAKTAFYSTNIPTQMVLAAGSASVASAGVIATGVSGGVDDKFVMVQIRKDDSVNPTVAAHVIETYAGSDNIKIGFTKLSDGTVDFGTYTVNWMVLANS